MIGQKIDRYDVLERLGQGGMGVVYKARDTLLGRYVALKVLPEDKSSDPERRQRFLGEAKAASALNHPGIVSVHDILTVDGQDVIVMELVEGETLEQRLARKRLSITEALGLAVQIADALGRAHAAGIVHRDLKPANVMLTPEGGVRILDFGLAKLIQAPFIDDEAETMSRHGGLTKERAVVGTVAWMSPEQASGQPVDARSDVFAFGVVLYEMLTGKHPFRRGTTTQTLAAIAGDDPEPPTTLNAALPVEAERAVLRCLRKEPARRWQGLSDLGSVLADIKEDSESGRGIVATSAPRRRTWGLASGAVALLLVALGTILALRLRPSTSAPLDLERLTYDSGLSWLPALSPDGSLVAYSSDRAGAGDLDIWVRQIHQPEPVRLTRHPADDWQPRFSPDGSRIVFRSERDGGGIYLVGALGGAERRIAPRGFFPRFSPDGAWVSYAEDPDFAPRRLVRMYRVSVEGGAPEPLVPDFGTWRPPGGIGPLWSPDGRFVLFVGAPFADLQQQDWWVAPVGGGAPRSSGMHDTLPREEEPRLPALWLPHHLVFVQGNTIEGLDLHWTPVSPEGQITGPAEALTSGPGLSWAPSATRDGRVALSRQQGIFHLWEVPLAATGRPAGPPRRLTHDDAPKFAFSLTRDGAHLAYSAWAGPWGSRRSEVRLQDRESGAETVAVSLKAGFRFSLQPRISPDGSLLSWQRNEDGRMVTVAAPVGQSAGRDLCERCVALAFLSDNRALLVNRGMRLDRIDVASGDETTVLEPDGRWIIDGDLSPDDRWLALSTGEPDGHVTLSVLPLRDPPPPPEEWIPIADRSRWTGDPRWSSDGRTVYYLSDRDDHTCVWAQELDPQTRRPVGEAFAVAHPHDSRKKSGMFSKSFWSLAVGGQRLVFNAMQSSGDVYVTVLPD
jgi:serine/threonine protein kinase